MTGEALALGGWMAAGLAVCLIAAGRRAIANRLEQVARACHEIRGPITAARLGIEFGMRAGELSPASLKAIDLELGCAALALDEVGTARPLAPGGRLQLRRSRVRNRRSGAGAPEPVDAEGLLGELVQGWQPAASASGSRLRMCWSGPTAQVCGSRLRLAQAVGNLIANAVEHGGGEIDVRGHTDRDRVRIEVIDEGAGLPAPVVTLARGARAGRGPRGRGLAIASEIAAAHGGRLVAAPNERGARLVLELPAAPAWGEREEPAPGAAV